MRLVSIVKKTFTSVLATLFLFLNLNAQCDAPTGLGVSSFRTSGANVNIYWNAVATATQYEYAITSSSTPPASGTLTTNTNASKVFVSTDNNIHVRAICPSGTSAWSTICFAVPNYLAGAGTYCDGQTASIGINGVKGDQNYYWYSQENGFAYYPGPPSGDGGSQSYNLSVSGAAQAGTYYINVFKSGCVDTYFGNAVIKYSYAQNLATTTVTPNSVSFNWNNSVTSVNHQYAVTTDINPPFTPTGSTSANNATVIGLTPNTTYYIHVQAECDNFSSTYNDWSTITFNTLGALPVKMEFFKAKNISNTNILNWKSLCAGSVSSQINFSIERSEDGNKFKPIHSFTTTYERCLQPFEFADKTITSQINYYRIKVTDETGKITYSSILKLDNKISKPAFNIFPNPIKDASVLQLQLNRDAKINVSIHDVSGRLLQNVIDGVSFTNGTHQVNLNTSKLSAGIYLCKVLIDGDEQKVIKLVKQ